MEGKKYHHLKLIDLENKLYLPFPVADVEVQTVRLSEEDDNLNLQPKFDLVRIPRVISNLLDDFFNVYNITSNNLSKSKLVTLISGAQLLFCSNQEVILDDLTNDFFNEKKERRLVLDLLERFQFSDRNFINEVNFKNHDETSKVRNFFVIADIYRALLQYWNLDIENQEGFRSQKENLLKELNQINPKKLNTYCKHIIAKSFYNTIDCLDISDNEKLKITGVFFICAQIPLSVNSNFEISPVFKENFSEISDYQHIRLILNRNQSFLIE